MSFDTVVHSLPAPICKEFEHALRCGVWRNGQVLTPQQRRICEKALGLLKSSVQETKAH